MKFQITTCLKEETSKDCDVQRQKKKPARIASKGPKSIYHFAKREPKHYADIQPAAALLPIACNQLLNLKH